MGGRLPLLAADGTRAPAGPAIAARPEVVYLAVTERCNVACVHCAMWQSSGPDLPTEAWFGIIDRIAAFCAPALVQFVGGEPMLRPDLERLVERAASRGLRVGLCTNGWPVTPARAGALASAGLEIAYVSLDGVSAEVVDATRGAAGSFEHARRAIETFAREPGVKVVLSSILHAKNANDFGGLVALAERENYALMMQTLNQTLGTRDAEPRWFMRSPLWPQDEAEQAAVSLGIDALLDGRQRGVRVLNTEAQLEAARAYYRDPLRPPSGPCPAGKTECGVGPTGELVLCFFHGRPLGSVVGGLDPAIAWTSPAATARRSDIAACLQACRLNTSNIRSFGVT
jgi:MoaA/NifB/PqqE/SkfB family radical SAM enzyme